VLARSGEYEVLVLEKGQNYFSGLGGTRPANLFANDELAYQVRPSPFDQDPLLEPRTFRPSPSAGPRSYVGDVDDLPVTVGGGTVHWDAKARRLREVDFMANTLLGGSASSPAVAGTTYSDWPITYAQIEPFYGLMEELVGIQGPAYRDAAGRIVNANPNESWRSTPFPMPPGVGMYSNLVQADALRRSGYHPAPVPTAVNSRPYRGRPACVDCAYCIDYGCPIDAKGGAIWLLNDAIATGRTSLRPGSNVVRVEVAPGRGPAGLARVDGVTYMDDEGGRHTEGADLVVLANSPIEAVRTSLASGIGRSQPDESALGSPQPGPYEPSGLLGRNLMLHYPTVVATILDSPVHPWRGRNSTHVFDDFAGSGPAPAGFDPQVPRAGITEMGGADFPINAALAIGPSSYGEAHKSYMTSGVATQRGISFTLQGEDMPQLTNYVDLDPEVVDVYGQPVPRITYSNHPYELEAAAYYTPKLMEVMDAIGGPGSAYPGVHAGQPFVLPPSSNVPSDKHIMGTHRMGFDPGSGATNPYGRYWAFSNLFHVGGGLFVTAPGFNPTLTIWALSYRTGAAILTGAAARRSFDAAAVADDQAGLLGVVRRLEPRTMAARSAGS
jgi:choline dehydrogenase-like flavoprotein